MACCFSGRVKAKCLPKDAGLYTTFASVPQLAASSSENEVLESSNLKIFGYIELERATQNYRVKNLVGEGRFGPVFKGWIDEHTFKASKKLGTGIPVAIEKTMDPEYLPDHNEWLSKITNLGKLDHPNVVKLIGHCLEQEKRMLVYEFMSKGSLDDHLFSSGSVDLPPLSWNLRMKIALDAAKGLAYLHTLESKDFRYFNFYPSCILLDTNYNAKLSHFGLEKDLPLDHAVRIPCDDGYHFAPEFYLTGQRTVKGNVYCFGLILLEMLTGQRSLDTKRPRGKEKLSEWVKHLRRTVGMRRVMDGRIEGQYSKVEAIKVVVLSMWCLSNDPIERPEMDLVVKVLEDLGDSDSYSMW